MKKLLVLLDTDNMNDIRFMANNFLKNEISIGPKGMEVWEVDEDNHMERRI